MHSNASRPTRRVLILGDNLFATSILTKLQATNLVLHRVVPQHFDAPTNTEIAHHKSDFSHASLEDIFSDLRPDLVINPSPRGGFETQKAIVDSATEAGVQRDIPAEFENDSQNARLQERLPPLRERGKSVDSLRQISDGDDQFGWVGIATGFLLDRGILSGNMGFDLQWKSVTMHGSGDERFAASSTAWIGEVGAAMIEYWHEVANQYIYAAGMVTSAGQVLRSLEEIGGVWDVGLGDVDECIREAERRIDRGFPDASMFLMERTVLYDEGLKAAEPFCERDAKKQLGLGHGENVVAVIKRALHQHKHHGKGGCRCD